MTDLIHVSQLSESELARAFRCRALPFTALVRQLKKTGLADAVRERLPAELRPWVDKPPAAMRWIPAVTLERLLEAIERCGDGGEIRNLARRSVSKEDFAFVARVARLALSAGRVEHHWIGKTLARALRRQMSGVDIEYQPCGDSGRLVIRYLHLQHVRETSFAYWQGLVEGVYSWTGTELQLSSPKILSMEGSGIAGSFEFRPLDAGR